MSRVAKTPIEIPIGIEILINNQSVIVKKNNVKLTYEVHNNVEVRQINNKLIFMPRKQHASSWMLAGTTRAILNNMIIGITEGFIKKLQLIGVGYRILVKDRVVSLFVGFSHPINYKLPAEVTADCLNQTEIILKGIDKQIVGQVAANLRSYCRPESYKGKGIRYADEIVHIKEAKKK